MKREATRGGISGEISSSNPLQKTRYGTQSPAGMTFISHQPIQISPRIPIPFGQSPLFYGRKPRHIPRNRSRFLHVGVISQEIAVQERTPEQPRLPARRWHWPACPFRAAGFNPAVWGQLRVEHNHDRQNRSDHQAESQQTAERRILVCGLSAADHLGAPILQQGLEFGGAVR